MVIPPMIINDVISFWSAAINNYYNGHCWGPANLSTYLRGDDSHNCLLGACLLITYVPKSPRKQINR